MAFRLDDLVIAGVICNSRPFAVHGQLVLRGQEMPFAIDLTGKPAEDLQGLNFEFEVPENDQPPTDEDRRRVAQLRAHQIGAVGEITAARNQKSKDHPAAGQSGDLPRDEAASSSWCQCLYLEWFSQNGQVVLELWDLDLHFFEIDRRRKSAQDVDADGKNPQSNETPAEKDGPPGDENDIPEPFPAMDADLAADPDRMAEDEEGYGLIPKELDQQLEQSAHRIDYEIATGSEEGAEDMREMELMDEVLESNDGTPIIEFLEKLNLPPPSSAELTESQAEQALKSVLTEMALLGVAFHICEHCTAIDAYRILMEKVCVEGTVHPKMRGTDWVQNFMTSDSCERCQAEFE